MTEHELRMQYLILEDNYRKLENRVAELELNLKLNKYLGLEEKFTNTSISLFLLRKDREKLSNDLGISISDYASVKSFGEEALESLIYEYSDILEDFKQSNLDESIKEVINNDDNITEKNTYEEVGNKSIIEVNIVEPEKVEEKVIYEKTIDEKPIDEKTIDEKTIDEKTIDEKTIEEKTIEEKPIDTSVVKKSGKRGRKPKSEKQADKPIEKQVEKSEEENLEFENLDDALNMWA